MTHPSHSDAVDSLVGFWLDAGMIDAREAQALTQMGAPKPQAQRRQTRGPTSRPPPRRLVSNPVAEAEKLARSAGTLAELKAAIEGFTGCDLRHAARNTVIFDGVTDAPMMLIGEAPGAEEDAKGLPFVGRSGQLQDRILAAIGLDRTANLFISNLVYWRPPGNRNPEPDELMVCAPFVRRMIELKQPKLILAAGRFSAQSLLGVSDGIMRLRGRKHAYTHPGLPSQIPCIPILHPSYLLRRPADKARAWEDAQIIAKLADELGVKRKVPL